MTHASLFSGIGGPEIAASMLGWENLFHCEINPFGRAVLGYWFPESKSYEDVTKTDFTEWRGRVDVLTGGFPCQPFSHAGKRKGAEDDRYLWPYMHRAIRQIRPTWFVCENVSGILSMVEQGCETQVGTETSLFGEDRGIYRKQSIFTVERICRDIEADGYEVQPILIPACSVGAPHKRDRVFIIGRIIENSNDSGQLCGQEEVEINKRNIRNTCTRDSERICREEDAGITSNAEGNGDNRRTRSVLPEERRSAQQYAKCILYGSVRTTTNTDSYRGREVHEHVQSVQSDGAESISTRRERTAADADYNKHTTQEQSCFFEEQRCVFQQQNKRIVKTKWIGGLFELPQSGQLRWQKFPTVSPIHRGNDGLPFDVDYLTFPQIPAWKEKTYFSKWREESIKAYGNAIVPQVMYQIFKAIESV